LVAVFCACQSANKSVLLS